MRSASIVATRLIAEPSPRAALAGEADTSVSRSQLSRARVVACIGHRAQLLSVRTLAALAVLATLNCGKDSSSSPTRVGPPSKVEILSGDGQSGVVGEELGTPLVVRVVDANDQPVQGQSVNFRVTAGGGSVFAGTSNTNADGVAQERWTLGTVAGSEQTIEARAVDNTTGAAIVFATFHATPVAGAPTALAFVTGVASTAQVGVPVAPPPALRLVDKYANAVKRAGVQVSASVSPAGDLSVDGTTTVATDDQGVATFSNLILRGRAGTGTLSFSATSLTPATSPSFTLAPGAPATLSALSANSLTGSVAAPVSPVPSVVVRDAAGNGVPYVSVQFAVSNGGGIIAPTSVATDQNGVASLTSWVLPNAVGSYSVMATASAVSGGAVTFTASAQPGAAAQIQIVSGDNAIGEVATDVPPLVVRVTDAYGNAINGGTVSWSITTGDGKLSASSTTTGADGKTQVVLTLPAAVGTTKVMAQIPGGATQVFTATAQAVAFATLTVQSGGSQSGPDLAPLHDPVVVRAADRFGNPVQGVTVTWTPTILGRVSPGTSTTDAAGLASTTWSLGQVGTDTLVATASGKTVTILANATLPNDYTLTKVSGDNQTAVIGTELPQPLTVRLSNQGVPVRGATIDWRVTSGGGIVSPTASSTDASGLASTRFRMGLTVETNVADASVNGGRDVGFWATATAPPSASAWSDTSLSAPGDFRSFAAVSGSSPSFVVAAGTDNRVVVYDGASWKDIGPFTSSSFAVMQGVWVSPANEIFGVGIGGLIARWTQGNGWTKVILPGEDLYGVWGFSDKDVFAVGIQNTVLHFDGVSWTGMNHPNNYGFRSVWGSSPTDVFAVGDNNFIIHYDGAQWVQMAVPSPAGTLFFGIRGRSATDVFAVGSNGVILHYDGAAWSMMNSGTTVDLYGVGGSPQGSVFAVGAAGTLLRFDGSSWSPVSITPSAASLLSVWESTSGDVFVVGAPWRILHKSP